MLQENVSEEFKVFFLMQFTKELIKHSLKTGTVVDIVEEEKKDTIKEKVKDALKKESASKKHELPEEFRKIDFGTSIIHPEPQPKPPMYHVPMIPVHAQRQQMRKPAPAVQMQRQRMPSLQPLRIPEPVLPQRLQYLKPIPTNKEIDLGKLNSLINDPAVRVIQCDGDDKNIVVIGTMGIKRTNVIMSKDDIDEVLNKFSAAAKIPLEEEGISRIVFGRLILSAIISKVISSRFIIRKMSYSSIFSGRPGMPLAGQSGRPPMPPKQQRPDEIIPRGVL